MKFIVIGISDAPQPFFTPEVLEIIKHGRVFSGGKRHHEIVANLLPDDSEWIDITVHLALLGKIKICCNGNRGLDGDIINRRNQIALFIREIASHLVDDFASMIFHFSVIRYIAATVSTDTYLKKIQFVVSMNSCYHILCFKQRVSQSSARPSACRSDAYGRKGWS